MFVYKITNKVNGKPYIGQSIRPIEARFKRHISDAINGVLDTHFTRAIRKYGPESFTLELLDTAKTQDELNLKEQYFIRLYDSISSGYNETDALNKCGGNTYMSKTNDDMSIICEKIRESKLGEKNPNSSSVKVLNVETGEELFFKTVDECRAFFNEKHHRFITTRVTGQTRSLYNGIWNIAYTNSDYIPREKKATRHQLLIDVINTKTHEKYTFYTITKMCECLGISRNRIKGQKDQHVFDYDIFFKIKEED